MATGQAVPELISSTGGLGTNILSALIVRLADGTRSPSRELAESELLAELRTQLEADDERAAALSRELAGLLRGVGATEIFAESSGCAEAADTLDLLGSSFGPLQRKAALTGDNALRTSQRSPSTTWPTSASLV
ncbi:hypothetical protein [Nonomuraea sp. NPDC049758]|uniref:hypothetical protein n=1 Tax=Nonomuraea sp. NPDC049758 TaxID=3154360 RepID=UPI003443F147